MDAKDKTLRISANPKSFFLYLLIIVALYAAVVSFAGLLFDYINIALLDVLNKGSAIFSIRWNIAVLLIAFSAYLYLFITIRRDYLKFPEHKALTIRKWAAYLTIFVASLVIFCNAIALIYGFLNGDLTLRFLAKIFVLFVIFIWLLYFTRHDLKQGWHSTALRIIGAVTTVLVIIVIGYGFSIIGSPFKARLYNLDSRRVDDLSNTQMRIVQFWKTKNKLPASLDELTNNISGFKAPTDPQTGDAYAYKTLSKSSFELCATFSLPSTAYREEVNAYGYYNYLPQENWTWKHDKGRYCFQRTIDQK